MILRAYRKKRTTRNLAVVEFDTDTGRTVRRTLKGIDIDNGYDACSFTETRFRGWLQEYPDIWSMDPLQGYWVDEDLRMDEGL